MLRFGNICDIDAAKGLARVQFDDDNITSAWLPILTNGSGGNKFTHAFDVNEQVACLMDQQSENGVILGALYSQDEVPPVTSADIVAVKFADDTLVKYDRAAHKLSVVIGTTEMEVGTAGFKIKRGAETIKAVLSDLLDQLVAETHISAAPGSPTSAPVNLAQYTAIKARVANLFT